MASNMFPCLKCKKDCVIDSIECSSCSKWIHRKCVPLTCKGIQSWKEKGLYFLCYRCCFTGKDYDFKKALERMELAVESDNKGRVLSAAKSERKLMETYHVALPAVHNHASPPGQEDSIAKDILRKCHPLLLEDMSPRAVYGDGNCMYRTVSLAMYGSESYHAQLRLITTLEIVENRPYYDNNHRLFVDLIEDQRILTPNFEDLVCAACVDGGYAEMLHIYALSAATKQCFTSYYPPTGGNAELTQPFNRRIKGRDVRVTNSSATLMWSQLKPIQRARDFRPNHFALLHTTVVAEDVDLTEEDAHSPSTGEKSDSQSLPRYSSTPKVHAEHPRSPLADSPGSVANSPGSAANSPSSVADSQGSLSPTPSMLSLTPSMSRDSSSSFSLQDDPMLHTPRSTHPEADISDSDSESIPGDHANSRSTEDELDTPRAHGILVNGRSLGLEEALEKVASAESILGSVPPGLKEDVFFVVSNKGNNERRSNKLKSEFMDDCGAWVTDKTGSPRSIYVKGANGRYELVYKKGEFYCKQKRVNKKVTYVPVDPQPAEDQLLIVHRSYSTLRLDNAYKRKVTWFSAVPNELPSSLTENAVYEYLGKYPGSTFHGNSKHGTHHYARCPSEVMQKVSQKNKHLKPTSAYAEYLQEEEDEALRPQNVKQFKNQKYREKRQQKIGAAKGEKVYTQNFADNVQRVENMVHSHPFVQSVVHLKDKVPSVICYTEDQLLDLQRSCLYQKEVLGFDKTYNLGDVHVTVSAYKNVTVRNTETGEHPIMLGPVLLHGSSTYTSYKAYFSHLADKIPAAPSGSGNQLVIGSDDEKAMKGAIHSAFPHACQVLCTRHLKNNTEDYLRNTDCDGKTRRAISKQIFYPGGLAESENQLVLEERTKSLKALVRRKAPKFLSYLETRLLPLLTKHVVEPYQQGAVRRNWTNNNCESLNAVLKRRTDRQQWNLGELVQKIYSIVVMQHQDLQRALIGRGNYFLEDAWQRHHMSPSVWASKDTAARRRHFLAYLKDKKCGHSRKFVSSTDGSRNVPTPNGGKKPGQRKRKPAERTVTFQNKKRKLSFVH